MKILQDAALIVHINCTHASTKMITVSTLWAHCFFVYDNKVQCCISHHNKRC